jgi:hypothetical protein
MAPGFVHDELVSPELQVSGASDVRPQELRQGVWSARASVVESNGVDDQIPNEASPPPASEIGSDQSPIEDTTTNVDSVPWRDDAQLTTHLTAGDRLTT